MNGCPHVHTAFIETPFVDLDGKPKVLAQQICEDCGEIIWQDFEALNDNTDYGQPLPPYRV